MQLSLAERTVLVSGGGSGIGKGVAAAVVAAGGNAMLVGRNADKLSAAADEITAQGSPGAVLYEPADVTNEDEVARAVEAATAWTGRLWGVVHCAGGSETIGPITQIDSEAWRRTVDLNINGTMYMVKHSAREMVRGGGGSFIVAWSISSTETDDRFPLSRNEFLLRSRASAGRSNASSTASITFGPAACNNHVETSAVVSPWSARNWWMSSPRYFSTMVAISTDRTIWNPSLPIFQPSTSSVSG